MLVPKIDALPLGYIPYGLVLNSKIGREGREKKGSKNELICVRMQGYNKQQGSSFRTNYNKLVALIETNGKFSALFSCNSIPIKVGKCFCNLRLIMLFN